jgi:uncharacterized protein (DUF433 family)
MRTSAPVIEPADRVGKYLSFSNLVEAHVLSGIRNKHGVTLDRVRIAVEYLRERLGSCRPLLEQQFSTDGIDLFVDKLGLLVNVSKGGQVGIRETLALHLKRIERDAFGIPIRIYPFTHARPEQETHRVIVIDPAVSFGRPALSRLGVPTSIIAERYKAGDTIAELMLDYGARQDEIEEAIRCELAA